MQTHDAQERHPIDEPTWIRSIGDSGFAPPPLSPEGRLRRGITAAGLCLTAAAPSFVIAVLGEYDVFALAVGVVLFATLMVAISWTNEFRMFTRRPFVRRTLFFVYGIRILVSAATPVLFFLDAIPGLLLSDLMNSLAIEFGLIDYINFAPREISGQAVAQPAWFFATLFMVLAQGILLNILIGILFLAAWTAQTLILSPREASSLRSCSRCMHSREGIPADRPCPECGWNDPEPPPTWLDRVRIRTLLVITAVACLITATTSSTLLVYAD